MELGRQQLLSLLTKLTDEVPGDWLLIGGAAVALTLDSRRTTADIDLVGLTGSSDQRHALLGFCARNGLPVETMNSAADFFVYQIADWREHLKPLLQGEQGRVFRPSATLLVELKMRRLAPRDLEDCLAALGAEPADKDRLQRSLAALPPSDDAPLIERRRALATALG